MTTVYLLLHEHSERIDGDTWVDFPRILGAYSSFALAHLGMQETSRRIDSEYPAGYGELTIDEYEVNARNWTDGFVETS